MTERAKNDPGFGTCAFYSLTDYGRPNVCGQCGTLLHEAAEDAKYDVDDRFRRIWWEKARSDSIFLVGLILGGPLMAIGSTFSTGLFIALAGGLSSVIRRY